mmetsp:Transcript_111732/g.271432  ORF Transcript_111732/g.271432 Transcript_111732/m.271432 type:complete len:342 (-) Transcript_111732:50-1075(-)
MVRSRLHAVAVGHLQRIVGIGQLLDRLGQIALCGRLGLHRGGLCALLPRHVLRVGRHLVFQRLLEHAVVVLRVGLRLPKRAELLLSLLLHVFEDVKDARAVRLVDGGGRGAQVLVLGLAALAGLHQGHEPGLVRGREGGGVHEGAERAEEGALAGRGHLREGGGVLGHLLLEDDEGAAERVDRVDELRLARGEVLGLALADGGGVREVGVGGGDARGQLLDLHRGGLGVRGFLGDRRLELLLLRGCGLDLELLVLRSIVTPSEELLVRLRLGLALLGHLRRQAVHELEHLAERVRGRAAPRREHLLSAVRSKSQDQGEHARGLHCTGIYNGRIYNGGRVGL